MQHHQLRIAHKKPHHVCEQHWQHTWQEGAQHVLVYFAFAERRPELAGLYCYALVLVLQNMRQRASVHSDAWPLLALPVQACQVGTSSAMSDSNSRPLLLLQTHLGRLEHVLDEVGHRGVQPLRHRHQHGNEPSADGLAHDGGRVERQREQALKEPARGRDPRNGNACSENAMKASACSANADQTECTASCCRCTGTGMQRSNTLHPKQRMARTGPCWP